SAATKREARSYLSRFKTGSPKTRKTASQEKDSSNGGPGSKLAALNESEAQKNSTDSNRFPSQNPSMVTDQVEEQDPDQLHVALVKFREPELVSDETLFGIGKSLSQLSMLGMSCCVVVDPGYIEDANTWRRAACEQAHRIAMAIDANMITEAECLEFANIVDASDMSRISMMERAYFTAPLRAGKVLVIPPIAYVRDNPKAVAVSADDLIVSLTKEFRGLQLTTDPNDDFRVTADHMKRIQRETSLDRLIILDRAGGLPAPRRGADKAHIFINLEQEFDDIVEELVESIEADTSSKSQLLSIGQRAVSSVGQSNPLSKFTEEQVVSLPDEVGLTHVYDPHAHHPLILRHHLGNLSLLHEALSLLPPSSSGIILTPEDANSSSLRDEAKHFSGVQTRRQRNPLLYNLLTDKPMHSPSLPVARMGMNRSIMPGTSRAPLKHSTFVKKGMPLSVFPDPRVTTWKPTQRGHGRMRLDDHRIDLGRLKYLIEDSFGRELDTQHYLDRIGDRLAGVIIAIPFLG
ncbi:eukaryotic translation initiation factor 2 subunit gamma, partial [Ascosphaera pollenicola]